MTTVGSQRITAYGHQVRIPRSHVTRALIIGVPVALLLSGQVSAASRNVSWGEPSGPSAADQAWLSSLTGAQVAESDGSLTPVGDPNQAVLPDGGDPTHLSAAGDGLVVAALPAGGVPTTAIPGDTSLPRGLVSSGVPVRVLQAYLAAASVTARRQPSCHLSWTLLAGIGRVESNHGRHGGNRIGQDGVVRPGIFGPRLDGSAGTAVIRDTDGGRYDGDAGYDRAVGPMQFIPGTWRGYGTDANGDGRADPQNMDDAALSAGRYLCASGHDLATAAGRWSAILTYNYSNDYAATVSAIADSYATGVVAAVPAAPVGVTTPPASTVPPGTTTLAPKEVPQVATPVTAPRPSPTPTSVVPPGEHPTPDPTTATATPSTTTPSTTAPSTTAPTTGAATPTDPSMTPSVAASGSATSPAASSPAASSPAATPTASESPTSAGPTVAPASPADTPTAAVTVAASTSLVPVVTTTSTGSPLPTSASSPTPGASSAAPPIAAATPVTPTPVSSPSP